VWSLDDDDDMMMKKKKMMMMTLPIKDMTIAGFWCQSCILSNNSETTDSSQISNIYLE
jgi:hypothetical protein